MLVAEELFLLLLNWRLRLVPVTRWRSLDPAPERAVRQALNEVLIDARPPRLREIGLLSLLHAVDLVPVVVPIGTEHSVAELRRRAASIVAGEYVGEAVRTLVHPGSGHEPGPPTVFTPGQSAP